MQASYRLLAYGLFFLFMTMRAFAGETLVFAVDLVRHGDRTPIHEIPKSPHEWAEGLGELTPTGMRQAYQLGSYLRKRYIDETHLLPSAYQSETIYVRSTDINRTLMTGISLLYGLYPLGTGPHLADSGLPALPQAFQPIPIHTVPNEEDKLLFVGFAQRGKPLACQKRLASIQAQLMRWEAATGMKLNNCIGVMELGDTLKIRLLHHVPLPKEITQKEADEIINLGKEAFASEFKKPQTGWTTGKRFIQHIALQLKQAKSGTSPLKYSLYMGHDSTIMSVMNALGVPLDTPPPYVSDVNIELIKRGEAWFVNVRYNDKPVALPACKGACSLDQFERVFLNMKK